MHQPQDWSRRGDGPRRRLIVSLGTPTLRQAVASDAASVRVLVRAAYAKWVPLIGREPKPMGADYEAAVARHRVDLTYLGGELAALIETIPCSDHLLVENVAVAPAFQGRGLGRFLMAHAERLAVEQGQAEIRLYTNQRFAENIRLYLALGYGIDREEQSALGVTIYMSKAVRASAGDQPQDRCRRGDGTRDSVTCK